LVGVSSIGLLFLLPCPAAPPAPRALAEGGRIVDLDLGYPGRISIRVNNKDDNTNLDRGVQTHSSKPLELTRRGPTNGQHTHSRPGPGPRAGVKGEGVAAPPSLLGAPAYAGGNRAIVGGIVGRISGRESTGQSRSTRLGLSLLASRLASQGGRRPALLRGREDRSARHNRNSLSFSFLFGEEQLIG
jgi:hypothetical protein